MRVAQKKAKIRHILDNIDRGMAEIAPLVTKKLIEEFEQTGVSPVFSKNGKITQFKFVQLGAKSSLIDKSCWNDIEREIVDYKDNFWSLEYDQTKYNPGLNTLHGKLLVVSKETGKSKEYDLIGSGSGFPSKLIKDIKQNLFK